ncbi:hypothetical protein H0266_18415 [Halobacillus locisalis]|uniref:Uncharacterized protein n=1 Tax=Halobacillus locisalis TaxID=220753 RepID=A0A838CXU4_9BACI|nr:hypothetical protein [Halobacillus locisalis]MBA2176857.1 hypothetical protein [Halobacillus locisalis]
MKRLQYFGIDGMVIGMVVPIICLLVLNWINGIEHFEAIKEMMTAIHVVTFVLAFISVVALVCKAVLKDNTSTAFMTLAIGTYIILVTCSGLMEATFVQMLFGELFTIVLYFYMYSYFKQLFELNDDISF